MLSDTVDKKTFNIMTREVTKTSVMDHPFSAHLPSGTWLFPQNRFFNVLLITTVQKTGILKRKSTKLNADTFNMYIIELLVDRKKWNVAENAQIPDIKSFSS